MASLLRTLPLLALALAALESCLVRIDLPHRPVEATLFLQAWLLWLVLGALACVPAWGCVRLLRRTRAGQGGERGDAAPPRSRAGGEAILLLGWMAAPVLAHGVLDRHTALAGRLTALVAVRPWLEVAGVLLALVVLLLLLARLTARIGTGRVALAVLVLSLGAGLFLPWRGAPRRGRGGEATGPNLLLLVWDTTRADHLLPYGYDRETTPHLARLAEEATVFEEARSVSCFTFTSHLSMLTGVYPSTHGARLLSMRYDPRRAATVADLLRRAGYRTAGFVGTDVLAGRTGIRYGFEVYDDRVDPPVCDTRAWKLVHDVQSVLARLVPALRHNGNPHWIQDFQRPAEEVLDAALAWIRDDEDDPRPWFCLVNLYDAHWPYLPRGPGRAKLVRPYDGPLDGYLFRSDAWRDGYQIDAADARHVADLYDAELFDLDRAVDGFLGALHLGAGGTAVLMTSDHGEAFGEAGRWKHEDITEPQVRVPLILRGPEPAPPGGRRVERASGVDVAPTLLGLAGLAPPPGTEGIDLRSEALAAPRGILIEDRDRLSPTDVRVALYEGPWKLVRSGLGEEVAYSLFDLRAPGVDEVDVASERPEVLAQLVAGLAERRRKADEEDARPTEDLQGLGDGLQALGYAGREERVPPGPEGEGGGASGKGD